jgi:hypothetical protein
MRKLLVIGIILLFIGLSISSTGDIIILDDTTPPVSTHILDPPEPDGKAGWYISNINVTLNATDDMSGVKEIRYTVNGVPGSIQGDNGTFIITDDGNDIEVVYWAIDNAGNVETPHNMFTIDMDQTKPNIDVRVDAFKESCSWYLIFTIIATDDMSGMEVVKIYINEGFHKEIIGSGPEYEFIIEWNNAFKKVDWRFEAHDVAGNTDSEIIPNFGNGFVSFPRIFGIIYNLEISEENVTFDALIIYSNYGGIHKFKRFTFPNDYEGYIGRFFIRAKFCDWYDWPPIEV